MHWPVWGLNMCCLGLLGCFGCFVSFIVFSFLFVVLGAAETNPDPSRYVAAVVIALAELGVVVNFSQTLDIAYLDETKRQLLLRVDSRNAAFNKRMYYFSLNHPSSIRQFEERRDMLKSFGQGHVGVVCLYGFDTTLSQDYVRWRCLRQLKLIPFFQK